MKDFIKDVFSEEEICEEDVKDVFSEKSRWISEMRANCASASIRLHTARLLTPGFMFLHSPAAPDIYTQSGRSEHFWRERAGIALHTYLVQGLLRSLQLPVPIEIKILFEGDKKKCVFSLESRQFEDRDIATMTRTMTMIMTKTKNSITLL